MSPTTVEVVELCLACFPPSKFSVSYPCPYLTHLLTPGGANLIEHHFGKIGGSHLSLFVLELKSGRRFPLLCLNFCFKTGSYVEGSGLELLIPLSLHPEYSVASCPGFFKNMILLFSPG